MSKVLATFDVRDLAVRRVGRGGRGAGWGGRGRAPRGHTRGCGCTSSCARARARARPRTSRRRRPGWRRSPRLGREWPGRAAWLSREGGSCGGSGGVSGGISGGGSGGCGVRWSGGLRGRWSVEWSGGRARREGGLRWSHRNGRRAHRAPIGRHRRRIRQRSARQGGRRRAADLRV